MVFMTHLHRIRRVCNNIVEEKNDRVHQTRLAINKINVSKVAGNEIKGNNGIRFNFYVAHFCFLHLVHYRALSCDEENLTININFLTKRIFSILKIL